MMSLFSWLSLLALGILAGVSFVFALAETSLFSLGKWQTRRLKTQHPRVGAQVAHLLDRPQDLLATIVLGNTVSNAALVLLALTGSLQQSWPVEWLVVVVVILGMVMLFCEVIPKALAVRRPEYWALRVAGPMLLLLRITRPLRSIAQRINGALLKSVVPASIQPHQAVTDEEVEELFEMGYQQGTLAFSEKEIILEIIGLDRRTAKEVMKPRTQMFTISDELSIEEMIEAARKARHRWLPVYDESPDRIVGVLDSHQLLLAPESELSEVMALPSFVPETMNLLELLKSLQRQQRGPALVVDEYGGIDGLVTTEDILEEVVGDIRSESQFEAALMDRLGKGRWRVKGNLRIEDFNAEYPDLGEVPEVETMGGLLTAQLEVIPKPGQSTVVRGLKLTALEADERRVKELLVEEVPKLRRR